MRLQCDVQLAEDYYLSKWRSGKSTEGKKEREKEKEREDNKERGDGKEGRRGKRHVVNHGPVAPMYYILSLSAESGFVHATALWRTMFNHLSVDSFGFN